MNREQWLHLRDGGIVLLVTTAICIAVVLFFSGCGYAKRKDPAVYTYDSAVVMLESARLHARDVKGWVVGPIACCDSMKPLVVNGDYFVVKPSAFDDSLLGKVCVYYPEWNKRQPVAHRLVSGNARSGFIASGDNTSRSESFEPVIASTYTGEVVGIYRIAK